MRPPTTVRVLIGLVAGFLLGLALTGSPSPAAAMTIGILTPVGTIFVNLIRMTVIPLVASMLIAGVGAMMSGEIDMQLDDAVVHVKAGDVLVQRKRVKMVTATLVLVTCVCLTACRQGSQPAPAALAPASAMTSTADVERELAKMEQDWVDAVLKRDIATVDRILADDFVATLPDGRLITKAQDIEELRSGAFSSESTTIEGVNVRVFGETAVVTFGQTEKSQYHGRAVSGRTLWTDVFVKRSGTWQIVAEHGSVAPDLPQPTGRAA